MGMFDENQDDEQKFQEAGNQSDENQEQDSDEDQNVEKPADPKPAEKTGHGMIDAPIGGLSYDETALAMKKHLASQPRVPFIIPLEPGERTGALKTVNLNGYNFVIKKNEYVMLPRQVVEILAESMQAGVSALMDNPANLANAGSKKKAALGLAGDSDDEE